ncbi:hypothetical protein HY285_01580 [Candidatus Peregrinibacteria bacterium]|nr:hypothetical protein [Candidatus Peregrinibacteria bacterium]MBI3816220.1 hypothetical protein [Candidatus Peregrinibacteria bacterium]
MRRLTPSCAILCALVLNSCAQRSLLPPAEVLHRAALASSTLRSATYTATADIAFGEKSSAVGGHLSLDGRLQDGGKQTQFHLIVTAHLGNGDAMHDVNADADVIVASPTEIYLRVNSVSVHPPLPAFSLDALNAFKDKWVRLPAAARPDGASTLTPDPGVLRAQSEVVTVTRDRGIESIDGHRAYHYDVSLDREKLLGFLRTSAAARSAAFDEANARSFVSAFDASGELWIDADRFFVDAVSWAIAPSAASAKTHPFSITVRAALGDHNAAPPVSPPSSAESLSPDVNVPTLEGENLSSASNPSSGSLDLVPPVMPNAPSPPMGSSSASSSPRSF